MAIMGVMAVPAGPSQALEPGHSPARSPPAPGGGGKRGAGRCREGGEVKGRNQGDGRLL